jgi:hypothetical protein
MMLAKTDEIDSELIGEHRFGNDIADDLRVRERRPVRPSGDVAKRVQSELKRRHVASRSS